MRNFCYPECTCKSYWVGFQVGKGNGLDAVHAIDDSCDAAAYNPGVTNCATL
ncbi:MAG: hypothetical protein WBF33_23435 [Candidatus Nitrosopolaris sp.]